MLRARWIGGWGVAPENLRVLADRFLPRAHHEFLPPTHSAPRTVVDSDCVIAWSLGAWHVLNAAAEGLRCRGRVFLLAPFQAFCSDYGLGGRCTRTQVRWLRRWIQKEPEAALHDFYTRAGLGYQIDGLPYAMESLLEGLDALEQDASPALKHFIERGLPDGWRAVVGGLDPLLDGRLIARTLPQCTLTESGSHAPETLLSVFKGDLDAI